jgi:hypothetical protein
MIHGDESVREPAFDRPRDNLEAAGTEGGRSIGPKKKPANLAVCGLKSNSKRVGGDGYNYSVLQQGCPLHSGDSRYSPNIYKASAA